MADGNDEFLAEKRIMVNENFNETVRKTGKSGVENTAEILSTSDKSAA